MKIRLVLAAALSAGLVVVVSTSAHAVGYAAVDLGTLGGSSSYATGINASGQVVGRSYTASGASRAFITGANGTGMTDLGTLGGSYSYASGINASGQVVGWSYTASGATRAFITGANGTGMTDLGTLGGSSSYASGINDSGQVVGRSLTLGGAYHAFYTGVGGTGMTDLGTLGGSSSASGINAGGQVVGTAEHVESYHDGSTYTRNHAFIASVNGGGMTDLGTLGGEWSEATGVNAMGQVVGSWDGAPTRAFITGANGTGITSFAGLPDGPGPFGSAGAMGINASGQVVGWSIAADGAYHAFLTGANGTGMIDLNSLVGLGGGDYFMWATGVNDAAQIIANSYLGHAYLLTPVPEADSWAMMLAGVALVGGAARRRKLHSL